MSEYTPITTDLRLLVGCFTTKLTDFERDKFNQLCDVLDSIHANLERENESLKAELDCARGEWDFWESTHVELPKDADGVPIRVGDKVQLIGNDPSTVSHMSLADDGWRVYVKYDGGIGTGSGEPKRIRHYHAPTVEDVLREMLDAWGELPSNETNDAIVAKYAKLLTLAGDAE